MSAHYDSDADIVWFPTGESDDIISERVPGGLRDYDRATHKLVAIEVWDASTRLPASILEALAAPNAAHGAAASRDFARFPATAPERWLDEKTLRRHLDDLGPAAAVVVGGDEVVADPQREGE